MNAPEGPAAPGSGTCDPEILALLDFEPVPRKRNVEGGWTAELQRELIARLARSGSPGRSCEEMGKDLGGLMKVYRSPLADSFRAAWDGAVALAKARQEEAARPVFVEPGSAAPSIDHRRKLLSSTALGGLPGQVMNERGEWEDLYLRAFLAAYLASRATLSSASDLGAAAAALAASSRAFASFAAARSAFFATAFCALSAAFASAAALRSAASLASTGARDWSCSSAFCLACAAWAARSWNELL
jgi:hypothetical protein